MLSGVMILFVGPRGGGKTTAIRAIQTQFLNVKKCITITTRGMRPDEKFGIDNFFVSNDTFFKMKHSGQFVETTEYLGEMYGTPVFELDAKLEAGHVAAAVDIVGADTYQRLGYKPFIFFIRPPSNEVQFARIKSRDPVLSDEEVDAQMRDTEKEYEWFRAHPVAIEIVNDNEQQMVEEIIAHLQDAGVGLIARK